MKRFMKFLLEQEKVIIKKGDETKTIKYKKFEQLERDGWALVEV